MAEAVGFTARVKRRMDGIRTRAMHLMIQHIIQDTPVKSGRLVANWGRDSYDPTVHDPSRRETMQRVRVETQALSADQPYRFTNPAPYARNAEFTGWRLTPPYQMVSRNVGAWDLFVRQASKDIRAGKKL